MKTESDESLVDSFNEGHEKSFDTLHTRYGKDLINIIRKRMTEIHYKDLSQDVWMKVFLNLKTYKHHDFFKWLYVIALNRYIDYYSYAKKKSNLRTCELSNENIPDIEYEEYDVRKLEAGILALKTKNQVEVVMLRLYRKMSFRDIAGLYKQKNINTVVGIFHYAKENLKKIINYGKT